MRRAIPLIIAVLALAPAPTYAQGAKLAPEAQVHLDQALVAYNAKDYSTAIREFEQAYAIDPNPALLYATAQAHRFAGNCPVALALYKQYLQSQPNETQVQATRVGITTCEETMPRPDPPKPPRPLEPVQPPPPVVASTEELPRPDLSPPRKDELMPWYKDPLGGALTISGVAGIGVGIGLLVMANGSKGRANTAEFRDDYLAAKDEAASRSRIGAIALTAGSALAIGGVVVYVLRERQPSHAVAAGTDGRTIYVAGRF